MKWMHVNGSRLQTWHQSAVQLFFRSQDPVEAFLLRKPKRWARKRRCCFLVLAVLPVVFSGKPQPGRQYEIYIYNVITYYYNKAKSTCISKYSNCFTCGDLCSHVPAWKTKTDQIVTNVDQSLKSLFHRQLQHLFATSLASNPSVVFLIPLPGMKVCISGNDATRRRRVHVECIRQLSMQLMEKWTLSFSEANSKHGGKSRMLLWQCIMPGNVGDNPAGRCYIWYMLIIL